MQVPLSTTVIAVLFLVTPAQVESKTQVVKVSVYYESLCPYSIAFIKHQLEPAYDLIGEYINVDFVPYGNAKHSIVDGNWSFECQHGKYECHGNKLQACALEEEKPQSVLVPLIACIMGSKNPDDDVEVRKCALKFDVSWENIKKCTYGEEGDNLLAAYGDRTHALNPKLKGVPTIIFYDIFDQEFQDGSLTNFLETVCNVLGSQTCPPQD